LGTPDMIEPTIAHLHLSQNGIVLQFQQLDVILKVGQRRPRFAALPGVIGDGLGIPTDKQIDFWLMPIAFRRDLRSSPTPSRYGHSGLSHLRIFGIIGAHTSFEILLYPWTSGNDIRAERATGFDK